MIDYDYTLQIDEGDEVKTFVPGLPKKIKNISFISGPNSAGKSTLMNIIAAGMYGDKIESVNKSLRADIEDLTNSEHKKLKFEINISSHDENIRLWLSKSDFDSKMVVKESLNQSEFKDLSFNEFMRKYDLIYDIPDNPRTRIKGLSKMVKADLSLLTSELKSFQKDFSKLINDVKNSTKEDELEKLRSIIINNNKVHDNLFNNLPSKKEYSKEVSKLLVAKRLVESNTNADSKKKQFEEAKRLIPSTAAIDKSIREKYDKSCREIEKLIREINNIITSTSGALLRIIEDNDRSVAINFGKLSFDNVLSSAKMPTNCLGTINAVSNLAEDYSHDCNIGDQKKCEMIRKMIDVAEGYKGYNLDIPGFGPIIDFINNMKKEYDVASKNTSKAQTAKSIINNCDDLKKRLFNLECLLKDLVKPNDDFDSNVNDEREKILTRIEREYKTAQDNRKTAVSNASVYGVSASNVAQVLSEYQKKYSALHAMDIQALSAKRDSINEEIAADDQQIELTKSMIKRAEERLDILNNSKDHPLKNRLDDLKLIFNNNTLLLNELIEAQKKQNSVESGSYGNYSPDDVYYVSLWEYLGQMMGTISHRDETFDVKSVNTIKNVITTTGGKIIYINDMGTGQTQMTYLMSLLKKNDNRIKIALFDEVSTMTRSTLNCLFDEFKELQKENKLLVGIAVQPNDDGELKIEEMGE